MKKRLLVLALILVALPYPVWYYGNWYAAGLANQVELIEFNMEDDFYYCNKWRPELLNPDNDPEITYTEVIRINYERPKTFIPSSTIKSKYEIDELKVSIFEWAITKNYSPKLVQYLMDKGFAPMDKFELKMLLFNVIRNRVNPEIAKKLLDMGAYPDFLDAAIARNNYEMVELLIKYGAPVNKTSDEFSPFHPLHTVALNTDMRIPKLLIENGALINPSKDAFKPPKGVMLDYLLASPLHYAVLKGNIPLIKFYLKCNADVNDLTTAITIYEPVNLSPDPYKRTPLDLIEALDRQIKQKSLTLPKHYPITNFINDPKTADKIKKILIDAGALRYDEHNPLFIKQIDKFNHLFK